MPELANFGYERFARFRSQGMLLEASYERSGYAPARRDARREGVRERIFDRRLDHTDRLTADRPRVIEALTNLAADSRRVRIPEVSEPAAPFRTPRVCGSERAEALARERGRLAPAPGVKLKVRGVRQRPFEAIWGQLGPIGARLRSRRWPFGAKLAAIWGHLGPAKVAIWGPKWPDVASLFSPPAKDNTFVPHDVFPLFARRGGCAEPIARAASSPRVRPEDRRSAPRRRAAVDARGSAPYRSAPLAPGLPGGPRWRNW